MVWKSGANPTDRKQIIALGAQGISPQEIQSITRVNEKTVRNILKEEEIGSPGARAVDVGQAIAQASSDKVQDGMPPGEGENDP